MILAWLACAFVAGIVLGSWIGLPLIPLLILAALGTATALLRRRRRGWTAAALLAVLLLGAARAPGAAGPPGPHDLSYYNGRTVQLSGVVTAEPDIRHRRELCRNCKTTHGGRQGPSDFWSARAPSAPEPAAGIWGCGRAQWEAPHSVQCRGHGFSRHPGSPGNSLNHELRPGYRSGPV
jgi:hypothetical protein